MLLGRMRATGIRLDYRSKTREIIGSLTSWIIRHINRAVNSTAHFLAKDAFNSLENRVIIVDVPSCI